MAQLKKFQTVPYLKKIIWQPYNDNNQPEKSMEFEPECAVILSTDAWEELADLKARAEKAEKELAEVRADRDNWQEIAGRGCLIKAGLEIYEETEKLKKELEKEKQNVDVCESMLIAKDLETKCLNKELAGHKRGEEILSEANRQLEDELLCVKSENTVLKMTIEHYKSGGNIKF